MNHINILIADDHALFRYGMRAMLSTVPGFEVVGEASTGTEVISKTSELRPHVVLMDIHMPGLNGIEATRRILKISPNVGIVIITMFEDYESMFAATRAGASGYVLKDADKDEVLKVVRAVASGKPHLGPQSTRGL